MSSATSPTRAAWTTPSGSFSPSLRRLSARPKTMPAPVAPNMITATASARATLESSVSIDGPEALGVGEEGARSVPLHDRVSGARAPRANSPHDEPHGRDGPDDAEHDQDRRGVVARQDGRVVAARGRSRRAAATPRGAPRHLRPGRPGPVRGVGWGAGQPRRARPRWRRERRRGRGRGRGRRPRSRRRRRGPCRRWSPAARRRSRSSPSPRRGRPRTRHRGPVALHRTSRRATHFVCITPGRFGPISRSG